MQRIPVLIVGGGPVGLALAGELGWRGVGCLLVEQTDGTIVTPKMNEVNVRTMEFCRRWGIAEQVHNCPFPRDHARDAVFVTSFTGYELGRIPRPAVAGAKPEPWSPMRLQTCSQMWFDPILRNFALSHPGVELRHRTRLESFEDTGAGVTAEIVDLETGKRETDRGGLSGRLRRRHQRDPRPARHRAHRAGHARPSGASVLPRAGFPQARRQGGGHVLSRHRPRRAVGQHPRRRSGQRHVAADDDRQRRPADAGEHRQGRADPPRRRQAVRRRVGGMQHLDAAEPRRGRTIPRAACSSRATPCTSFRRPARWA